MNQRQRTVWIVALTASAMVGPGISYGRLYLFHIVLLAAGIALFRAEGPGALWSRFRSFRTTFLYMVAFAVVCAIAGLRSPDPGQGMITLGALGLGHLLVVVLFLLVKDRQSWMMMAWTVLACVSLELVLSLLEATGHVRWPISRFAEHVEWFGRTNDLAALVTTPGNAWYIATSPTGFHWNPNDLCTVLVLFVPFALCWKRRWLGLVPCVLVLVVCIMSGARIAYVGIAMVAMLAVFFVRSSRAQAAILLGLILLISTNVFSSLYSHAIKVREMQVFSRMLVGADIDREQLTSLGDEEEGSAGMRRQVYATGWQALKGSHFMGLGAGSTAVVLAAHSMPDGRVLTDMHLWWLEIAVDLGLPGLAIHVAWLVMILLALWRSWRTNTTAEQPVFAALIIALIVLGPLAIGPSSMAYMLPMYVLFAMAITAPLYLGRDAVQPD